MVEKEAQNEDLKDKSQGKEIEQKPILEQNESESAKPSQSNLRPNSEVLSKPEMSQPQLSSRSSRNDSLPQKIFDSSQREESQQMDEKTEIDMQDKLISMIGNGA